MSLSAGTRLGPYEITAQIGVGGMGEVYCATDTNLKRQVAIKILPEAVASDVERLARFQREAEVLASLNHSNIAQVHGLEKSGGTTALVMELVEGPTLADRIAVGPIPVDEALPIAKQIAEALEAAHEQGIIHRDLKPANVKVRADGTVKVLDFGLAKAMEPAKGMSPGASQSPTITTPAMTQAGMILGTAAYMSPEQARGKPVDRRADIWAFGCVLYEMLTGRRAFEAEDVSLTLAEVMRSEPDMGALPDDTPAGVRQALRLCLQKSPRQRGGDIAAIRLALEGAFETTPPQATASVVAAQPIWRRVFQVAVAVLAGGLVVGLGAWSLWPTTEPPAVIRFDYILPDGHRFRNTTQPVTAFSPDGRHFVYNTAAGLYLRTMGELNARLIPGTEAALTGPFFSPDGQSVGYFQANQLKRIAISGGTPVVICAATNPFGVSWAPDDTILFGQPVGIMRVPANGGTPELVIRAREGEQVYGPQMLPDVDSVLFSATTGTGASRWDEAQVVVQSLSSGERTVVVQGGSDARYLPTGHIVYALRGGVFGVAFDVSRLTATGSAVPLVQGVQRSVGMGATGVAHYAVSEQGTLVYAADDTALRSPVWVNRNGTPGGSFESIPAGSYEAPRLTSDGGRAMVERDGDIWIFEVASGRSSRLTTDGSSQMAVWDPTGSQVAYSSSRGGSVEAWVEPSDGSGEPRQLTELGGQVHVDSWSPDGRTLSVHHHPPQGPGNILMLSMDGTVPKPRLFLEGGFSQEAADFSPDARYVAYVSRETGQLEIYIRPYPGPGGQATVSVGGGREPVWAKNGELFYRSLTGRMMAVSVTTKPSLKIGTQAQLFEGPYYISPTGSLRPQYDVTADGQQFLMLAASSGADSSGARPRMVVVQNWFEELKRLVPTK